MRNLNWPEDEETKVQLAEKDLWEVLDMVEYARQLFKTKLAGLRQQIDREKSLSRKEKLEKRVASLYESYLESLLLIENYLKVRSRQAPAARKQN